MYLYSGFGANGHLILRDDQLNMIYHMVHIYINISSLLFFASAGC